MILLVRTPVNSINHNSSKPKWLSRHLVLHVLHLLRPTQLQKRNCFSQLSQRPPTPDFSGGQLVWKSLENVSWRDWKEKEWGGIQVQFSLDDGKVRWYPAVNLNRECCIYIYSIYMCIYSYLGLFGWIPIHHIPRHTQSNHSTIPYNHHQ